MTIEGFLRKGKRPPSVTPPKENGRSRLKLAAKAAEGSDPLQGQLQNPEQINTNHHNLCVNIVGLSKRITTDISKSRTKVTDNDYYIIM